MTQTTQLSAPPENRCRACDAALPPGASACPNCGAVFGEQNRCPHCRTIAGVDVTAGVGRCRVCGGPRIAVADPGIARSSGENELLKQAHAAALGITVARLASYAAYGAAAFTAVFAGVLGLVLQGAVAPLTIVMLAALLAAAGVLLGRRAQRGRAQQTQALDQAQQIVASDVLRQRPQLESAELGRLLGLSAERAELLLAELNVNNLLSAGAPMANHERVAVEPIDAELGAIPAIEPTQEAPPLGNTELIAPLAGSSRRS